MISGEEQAWEKLAKLHPGDVCRRARVDYDPSTGCYVLRCFSGDIHISLEQRSMAGNSPAGRYLLEDLDHLSRLSILWYLNNAKNASLSGELVKPGELPGGEIFLKGSHVLPLQEIASKYGGNPEGFLTRGHDLGGEPMEYGDAALRLSPFPRVPVILILREKDEEFPANADLLLDSTSSLHLPTDIIWSTAMVTVKMILK